LQQSKIWSPIFVLEGTGTWFEAAANSPASAKRMMATSGRRKTALLTGAYLSFSLPLGAFMQVRVYCAITFFNTMHPSLAKKEFGLVATAQHRTKLWPCSIQSGTKQQGNEENGTIYHVDPPMS